MRLQPARKMNVFYVPELLMLGVAARIDTSRSENFAAHHVVAASWQYFEPEDRATF
jgi:hypothetical protein